MRHFIISWSRVYVPLSSDKFKKTFKMTGLVVIIVVGIQGCLESHGREDVERQKETHPEDGYISLVVLGIGRRVILGTKACFYLCGPSIFRFMSNDLFQTSEVTYACHVLKLICFKMIVLCRLDHVDLEYAKSEEN